MADALFELLPPDLKFHLALDIGSATGRVAFELSGRNPSSSVIALDISRAMLKKAKERSSAGGSSGHFSCVVSDFEELPFRSCSIDLVISNLTYQWADSLPKAFEELYRVLAPGGLVLMNTLTEGTLYELKESFGAAEEKTKKSRKREFMDFVEPQKLRCAVEGFGLKLSLFDERTSVREYKDMWELLSVFKNIGATNPLPVPGASLGLGSLLKSAADIYKERFSLNARGEGEPGKVCATYKTVFIKAQKPL